MVIAFVLLLIGVILLGLATFNVASPRFNLVAAGLFFWALSVLIVGFPGL